MESGIYALTPKPGQEDGEGARLLGERGEGSKAQEARCVQVQRDKGSGAMKQSRPRPCPAAHLHPDSPPP